MTLLRAASHSFLLLALLVVVGCGERPPSVVHGDAYLAEDLTAEIDLAGLTVRVIPEDAQLDSALARFCPTREAEPGAGAATHAEAWRLREELLSASTEEVATTDSLAQYSLRVPPGRYRLWADTTVGTRRWTWLLPVRVRSGDTVRVNLTNANRDENPFRC